VLFIVSNNAENLIRKGIGWKMEKFFKLKERGTNVRTEVVAGITTFMTMAYILMVNSGMFSGGLGVSYGAIYIATAVSAIIGTVLIGLMANLPLAQASAMGSNAFFVYTVCIGFGLTYQNALVLVMFDGILFIIFSVTGLRKYIFNAIPKAVKVAIPAGIGMFIAFLGFQNSGLVANDDSTLVTLMSMNVLKDDISWGTLMPVFITILTLVLIVVFTKKNIKGSVLWAMLAGAVIYYLLGLTVNGFYDNLGVEFSSPFTAFKEFGEQSFGQVFTNGFDFSAYLVDHSTVEFVLLITTTCLAFCMVDMFDTLGTLYGACARGDLLTKEGNVPKMNQAMLADAIATTTGAILGTSTVSTYVESSSGIAAGGRTGLTSLVTGGCFFVAMFLSPVAQLIPGYVTSAVLVYVGVLMMACVKDIDWKDVEIAVPAFMTMMIMVLTYNISYGIGFGLISYCLIKLFLGKVKDVRITTAIIAILFVAMFLLTH
jgi:AGZA family xanthine/uracil permease-like MFS transporter